jgi:hypothetical protein
VGKKIGINARRKARKQKAVHAHVLDVGGTTDILTLSVPIPESTDKGKIRKMIWEFKLSGFEVAQVPPRTVILTHRLPKGKVLSQIVEVMSVIHSILDTTIGVGVTPVWDGRTESV